MKISKRKQRVLNALAQGGAIKHARVAKGQIIAVLCLTREEPILTDCDLAQFQRLRQRGLISSVNCQPCRITLLGHRSVRSLMDNRHAP